MTFDLADFMAPLSVPTFLTAFLTGIALGLVLRQRGYPSTRSQVFWMIAGGAVFFVPLAIVRGIEGSEIWVRLLAVYVLWIVFVLGTAIGDRRR